jgi:O-antigen ligase
MREKKFNIIYCLFTLLLFPAIIAQLGGFDSTDQEIVNVYSQGSIISRLFYSILFMCLLYITFNKNKSLFWTKYELLLIVYLFLGVFYSQTPIIVLRGIFTAITILLMWNIVGRLISTGFSLKTTAKSFIKFMIVYGFIELLFWYIDASRIDRYGAMGHYIGYFQQSNLFAKTISFGLILNIFYLLSEKGRQWKLWLSAIIFILFILGSGSRTTFIALTVSVVFTIIITTRIKLRYILLILLIGFIAQDTLKSFFISYFNKTENNLSSNMLEAGTLLVRLNMWDSLIPEMIKNFWFGVGLNSFWTPVTMIAYNTPGIHNGYLQVFQDLGFIGLILVVLIHVPLIRDAIKLNLNDDESNIFRNFLISCWIFFLIINITEGDLGNYHSAAWGLIVVFSIIYSLHVHKKTNNILITELSVRD